MNGRVCVFARTYTSTHLYFRNIFSSGFNIRSLVLFFYFFVSIFFSLLSRYIVITSILFPMVVPRSIFRSFQSVSFSPFPTKPQLTPSRILSLPFYGTRFYHDFVAVGGTIPSSSQDNEINVRCRAVR